MGGRGSSSGAKGGGTKIGASNAKYNGFSITDSDGNTENYIVINGIVGYADERRNNALTGANTPVIMQNAYDSIGSVNGIIERVNSIGSGKASILPDSDVEKIQKLHSEERSKSEAQLTQFYSGNKKSVNRHRNFWSSM